MLEKICLHIDPTSNAVLSRGLLAEDFVSEIIHSPVNLLLLDTGTSQGEYEPHTGMKIIRGNEAVLSYFNLLQKRNSLREVKWIDFTDITMLKELSPIEISELLYFGHTKTNLRSPFFYKLQNNFAYFEGSGDSTKIYYRSLDEFYKILGRKLAKLLEQKLNEKRGFFKKGTSVEAVDMSLLKQFKNVFQEGVCFNFKDVEMMPEQEFEIPVYVVEDRFWNTPAVVCRKEDLAAHFVYCLENKTWSVRHMDENSPFLAPKNAKLNSLF